MRGGREKPADVQKQEEAERKRQKAKIQEENNKIVAALNRAVGAIESYRDQQQGTESKNHFREWAGIGGIYLADRRQ